MQLAQNFLIPRPTKDSEEKYKTELCRNWEIGHCEFGDKCVFAHGQEELRSKNYASNYRTKPCKQFYSLGYCLYGARCLFSHHKTSTRLPIFIAIELRGQREYD
jgi:hypothetical protein